MTWVARSTGAVGMSVCSLADKPDEAAGRKLAAERADAADVLTKTDDMWPGDDPIVLVIPRPRTGRRRVTEDELLRAFRVVCFLKWAARKVKYRHEATEPERWGGFYAWLVAKRRAELARLKAARLAVQKAEQDKARKHRLARLRAQARAQRNVQGKNSLPPTLFGLPVIQSGGPEKPQAQQRFFVIPDGNQVILRAALRVLAEDELRRQVQGSPEPGKPIVGMMGGAAPDPTATHHE